MINEIVLTLRRFARNFRELGDRFTVVERRLQRLDGTP